MKKPLLSEMTLREKIGQMLAPMQAEVFGINEGSYNDEKCDMEKVRKVYAREQFGTLRGEQVSVYFADPEHPKRVLHNGYIEGGIFSFMNYKVPSAPYQKFLHKISDYMKIPPLVGCDCGTGGSNVFEDLSTIVNATAIGAADSEELTFALGAALARELRCAGMNWRWAPVLDLGNRNESAVSRTFAIDDVERTVRLSKAYIRGMQSEGVAATAKHFPSLGRSEGRDSHFTSLYNPDSMETWWSEQGAVYREIINDGVYSVMMGHQAFPAADDTIINGKYIPSTLSKKIVTGLLKETLGFEGVVITDGIGMASLFSLLPYEELIVGLVNAGNDVILGAKLPSGDIIERAVLDGRIPESRIDDACRRILDMKEKLGLFREDYWELPYKAADVVGKTKKISTEIAKRSMTLVRDRCGMLPLDKEKIKRVSVIISTHYEKFTYQMEELKRALEERGIEVYMQRRLSNGAELKEIADKSDLIIYAAYVQMHCPSGYPRLFGEECMTYYHAFHYGKEKSIGVSFGYPYIHYDTMDNVDTFINAYNPSAESMRAFIDAIFGDIPIVGKSPVLLIPRANSY